jgi:hypothetical protein
LLWAAPKSVRENSLILDAHPYQKAELAVNGQMPENIFQARKKRVT